MKTLKSIVFALLGLLLLSYPSFSQQNLSADLKAILIVGDLQDGTGRAMKNMDRIGDLFSEMGVKTHKFYDDEANWEEIIEVSKDCNFLVYAGHGSTMGVDGNVGGLCINSMVSTAKILKELRLKDNAMVLFKSVCNGAGSSAGDDEDIGIKEAKNRVSHYAYPFFEIGASAYYANNYGSGVYNFLKDFLSGTELQAAYHKSAKLWTDIEFEEAFARDPSKSFSIASSPGGGTAIRTTYTNGVKKVEKVKSPKGYEIAYVGKTGFSIEDMHQQ